MKSTQSCGPISIGYANVSEKGFEDLLRRPVSYSEECALPAFHIFIFDGGDQTDDHRRAGRTSTCNGWIQCQDAVSKKLFLSHYLSRALTR